MRQVYDCPHDGGIVGVSTDIPHESMVDFEIVDVEAFQIGQAGKTRAEVVDGELDAEPLQLREQTHRFFGVGHQDTLGNLQFKLLGTQTRFDQRLLDPLRKFSVEKLSRREIHRHRLHREIRLTPTFHLLASLANHPLADRHDEPAVFGDRNEGAGQDQPFLRMIPAQKRLVSNNGSRREIDAWLVIKLEFIA